jgi:hypothetical protein
LRFLYAFRVVAYQADFDRLVARAFEKIRRAADEMPAVMIRQTRCADEDHGSNTTPRANGS